MASQKVTNYKDLLYWQKAYNVTIKIIKLSREIELNYASRVILQQLIRSSASVGANISEGFGRYKGKEYRRFLQIALGSANETEYWLLVLKECYPKKMSEIDDIIVANLETIKMLAKSLKTLNSKDK